MNQKPLLIAVAAACLYSLPALAQDRLDELMGAGAPPKVKKQTVHDNIQKAQRKVYASNHHWYSFLSARQKKLNKLQTATSYSAYTMSGQAAGNAIWGPNSPLVGKEARPLPKKPHRKFHLF